MSIMCQAQGYSSKQRKKFPILSELQINVKLQLC